MGLKLFHRSDPHAWVKNWVVISLSEFTCNYKSFLLVPNLSKISLETLGRGAEAHFWSQLIFFKDCLGTRGRLKLCHLIKLVETFWDQTWPQYWSQKGPKTLLKRVQKVKTGSHHGSLGWCLGNLNETLLTFRFHLGYFIETFRLLGLISASEGLVLSSLRPFLGSGQKNVPF